ncbi:MAG: class I adenylate-forming enzyme family protein [Pseudomonadota bacterium]
MKQEFTSAGFTGPLPPPAFNMAAYAIGRSAHAHPDRIALLVCDRPEGPPTETWTFADLETACLRIGAGLARSGLNRGDRLIIRLPNTSQFAFVFFGAIAAGYVPVPTSTQLTDRETAFLLRDSSAKLLCSDTAHAPGTVPDGVAQLTPDDLAKFQTDLAATTYAETAADDPAYLIYTSGTTSQPKGVLHAHRAAWGRRPMYTGWYDIGADDRMLHAGAFNWTYTLGTGLTDPWANGAMSIVYTGDKTPDVWPKLMQTHDATLFAAVPGLYRQILKYARPGASGLGPLRHGLIAGEQPPPGLLDEWRADNGRQLYEALGMSEISTYISSSPTSPPRPGFVGRPQPGRVVTILPVDDGTDPLPPGEQGLLAIHRSDPGLMLGYWNRPDSVTAEVIRGDWFIGGDLAIQDADGYVAHRGRANDIMKALGYRVSPMEVEAVLAEIDDVAEVACAEIAVRSDVSVIGAFVVPRDPNRPPDPNVIHAHMQERLAQYKCPREIVFIDALPRTANGKLKRSELSQLGKPRS